MNRLESLFVIFTEELAETSQVASKCLRFGLDNQKPGQEKTNRERLVEEFNDILAVLEMIQEEGVELGGIANSVSLAKKKAKVESHLRNESQV